MIPTIEVKNKLSHVANKIEQKLNTVCNIDILFDNVLDDIGMLTYNDPSFYFVFEFDSTIADFSPDILENLPSSTPF